MIYVSTETIQFEYTIPVKMHANSNALRYHLEVYNAANGQKAFFSDPVVVPAVDMSIPYPEGVPGSVTFSGVTLPQDGIFLINLYYANKDDLDMPDVRMVRVANKTVQRITPVTLVNA